jgi:hypothetical protein
MGLADVAVSVGVLLAHSASWSSLQLWSVTALATGAAGFAVAGVILVVRRRKRRIQAAPTAQWAYSLNGGSGEGLGEEAAAEAPEPPPRGPERRSDRRFTVMVSAVFFVAGSCVSVLTTLLVRPIR